VLPYSWHPFKPCGFQTGPLPQFEFECRHGKGYRDSFWSASVGSAAWSPVPKCEAPGHPFQWKNALPWRLDPPPKSESSASKIFRHSGMTVVFKTTFEVFTRVGPDNSLERLTERSVGLVTDQPSDIYELFVALL